MKPKRIFIPGEEWLYYKIYCGARTADQILVNVLAPFTTNLLEKRQIDQWFFIRYSDPDFHLRIRFRITDTKHLGTVISGFKNILRSYVENDIIYKVQTDTYIRELERYGDQNIETSERLFFKESVCLLNLRSMIEDESLYFITIIKMIDTLLDNFGYDSQSKLQLAVDNANSYKKEFEAGKHLTKQLDKKYRGNQTDIRTFFANPQKNEDYKTLNTIIQNYAEDLTTDIEKVLQFLDTSKKTLTRNSLISSYIHMLVNRAFRSKQRFYELVCYDFLAKFYKEQVYAIKGN